MRLYLDEDAMSDALAAALRSRGVDVLTAQEAGTRGWPDEAQLTYAAERDRVLYSFNRADYARLHSSWVAEGRSHSGIVLLTDRNAGVGYQLRSIIAFLEVDEGTRRNSCHYI